MATKKEKEIIADIRNKFSPILNYFQMRKEVREGNLRPEQKEDLYKYIDQDDQNSQENVFKIKELLDSLG